ncbi:MAG TPA: hypothetical protein VMC07_00990 [Candidatus Omnitrophota bacterium]|nr:hypothetical protein [Candidatus Omnitrophota bacterium]
MPKEKESYKQSFIWMGLRIGFWTLIGLYVISLAISFIYPKMSLSNNTLLLIIGGIQTLAVFFTFVVSIIHLKKYKNKAFAIVALVISSLFILIFLLSFLGGLLIAMNQVPTA